MGVVNEWADTIPVTAVVAVDIPTTLGIEERVEGVVWGEREGE